MFHRKAPLRFLPSTGETARPLCCHPAGLAPRAMLWFLVCPTSHLLVVGEDGRLLRARAGMFCPEFST